MMGILEQSIFHHICESHRQVECQSNELNHFWAKQIYLSDSDSGNLFHRYNVSIEKYQKNTENEPIPSMEALILMNFVELLHFSVRWLELNSQEVKQFLISRTRSMQDILVMVTYEKNSKKWKFSQRSEILENINFKKLWKQWTKKQHKNTLYIFYFCILKSI